MRRRSIVIMSGFLYTLLGLTVGSSLHCAQRPQISPCTCTYNLPNGQPAAHSRDALNVHVACEKMTSFADVRHALKGHFGADTRLTLRITHSTLDDLEAPEGLGFADLGLWVYKLNISENHLRSLRPDAFQSMGNVTFLNLANNLLSEVPSDSLHHMPKLRTLSLGGNKIQLLRDSDFQGMNDLDVLVVTDNEITEVGDNTFPSRLRRLGIARNKLTSLNGSLRNLTELEWLYIEQNALTSLEGELPVTGKLMHLNATHNLLTSVPEDLYQQTALEMILLNHNEISALGGALKKSRKLQYLGLTYNQITSLNEDEFLECEKLQVVALGHNKITELNGALRPLRAVMRISLHHNLLTEFDLSQVRGLKTLTELDLRHNRINRLLSRVEMQNVVESLDNPNLAELRLGHNELSTLDGFLLGLRNLRLLDLSYNQLRHLPPDELVGLDSLKFLDISHNQISTLADTATKLLPSLETLLAGHNDLTTLDTDLHGFPKICFADLSHNKITTLGNAIASRSACVVKDVIATLRVFLQGNEIECTQKLAIAKEINEGFRAELVGVPECEKFASPPVIPSVIPSPTAPMASIPEILEVKKLDVGDESSVKRQPFMDELNEAAYHAESDSGQEKEQSLQESVIQVGPLLQALVSTSTPPAE